MAAFAVTMPLVPIFAFIAGADDWLYMRAVEVLVDEGRVQLPSLSAANVLSQIGWGAAWGELFGTSPGSLRASTVILWLCGGFPFYALLLELTGDRSKSALGTAVFVFNPLCYALAFSFMTDAPFLVLLVTSLYCYVRGTSDHSSQRWTVAGSVAAAAAGLLRQPGVLIPIGVLLALVLEGRLGADRRGTALLLRVAALPLATYGTFAVWLRLGHVERAAQSLFQDALLDEGVSGFALDVLLTFFQESMYFAVFLTPIAVVAVSRPRAPGRLITRRAMALCGTWVVLVGTLAGSLAAAGIAVPYGNWWTPAGLLPSVDFRGGRPPIVGRELQVGATATAVVCLMVLAPALVHAVQRRRALSAAPHAASILVASLGIQAVAVVAPSALFRPLSIDRYFLPLFPLELAIVLWGLRGSQLSMAAGWLVAALLAVFAVAGTRDGLTFTAEVWHLAAEANKLGIPNHHLDAGAAWDGYFEGDLAAHPASDQNPNSPWWLNLYNLNIDPRYVVATRKQAGYAAIVLERPYKLWLDPPPRRLLLLRRDDVPGPP